MADRNDLESAISDAEGAAAVLSTLENYLESSTKDGWTILMLQPQPGLSVVVLDKASRMALDYASRHLQDMVDEVSRVFYAAVKGGAL